VTFDNLKPASPDPILGLTESFKKDPRPHKVNLGVGVYVDEAGHTPVLESVKLAEQALLQSELSKSYLGISGDPRFGKAVQQLIAPAVAESVLSTRCRTAQTPGGTGALRVGAEFLHITNPTARVWCSRPTWATHPAIFSAAGFAVKEYPYYDAARKTLDFEGLLESLRQVPSGDVVLFHVCCHNPTGVDPDEKQWLAVADIAAAQGWIPFFDFAYQGFGAGLTEDALPLKPFFEKGMEFLAASSFSKNFGLYNERVGALTVVASSEQGAENAFSHVKVVIRRMYSNPPAHGAHIVMSVLSNADWKGKWELEVESMRRRIHSVRRELVAQLRARKAPIDFGFLETQQGMFSFSGLSDQHVEWLRQEKAIYMVKGGRINVAGLNHKNLDYVCDSIAESLQRWPS
jgi:aspartate/tyrosine/aromatic aminotransferase